MEKVMDDHVASDQRQAVKRAAGEGSALAAKAAGIINYSCAPFPCLNN